MSRTFSNTPPAQLVIDGVAVVLGAEAEPVDRSVGRRRGRVEGERPCVRRRRGGLFDLIEAGASVGPAAHGREGELGAVVDAVARGFDRAQRHFGEVTQRQKLDRHAPSHGRDYTAPTGRNHSRAGR